MPSNFASLPGPIEFLDKNNQPWDSNLNSCSGGFRPRCRAFPLLAAGGTAGGNWISSLPVGRGDALLAGRASTHSEPVGIQDFANFCTSFPGLSNSRANSWGG